MKILITAGGTTEKIDEVRSITNTSTGKLGSLIADEFNQYPEVDTIFYICAKTSALPKADKVITKIISDVESLEGTVTKILKEEKIDIIIHSMAVSDYRIKAVSSVDEIMNHVSSANQLNSEMLLSAMEYSNLAKTTSKISSDIENPLLLMEKTPKIISMLKKLAPDSVVVGFKLLNKVTKEELIDTAYQLLLKNKCEFVLANDLSSIKDGHHIGYLIDHDKNNQYFTNKLEIAKGISDSALKVWRNKN